MMPEYQACCDVCDWVGTWHEDNWAAGQDKAVLEWTAHRKHEHPEPTCRLTSRTTSAKPISPLMAAARKFRPHLTDPYPASPRGYA